MAFGVIVAGLGAAVAAVFTAQLARQYLARHRHHALAWAMALALYTVGMAVLAVGIASGWDPYTFGLYWLAGALLNVALLAVGQLHLLDPARSSLWWTLGGLAAVWSVAAVALTPQDAGALAAASADGGIPAGQEVFGSDGLAWQVLSPITMTASLIVLGGSTWSGIRQRRPGVLLIALGVAVAATSSAFLRAGMEVMVPAALTVGVAVMYAGFRSAAKPSRPRGRPAEDESRSSFSQA